MDGFPVSLIHVSVAILLLLTGATVCQRSWIEERLNTNNIDNKSPLVDSQGRCPTITLDCPCGPEGRISITSFNQ